MTFIETLIKDPTSIRNYPTKQIDVLNHDFGSENLEDRIYSLYSWLAEGHEITTNIKSKLIQFKSELEFLKLVNKSKSPKSTQKLWNELVTESRQKKINIIGV